MKKILAIVFYFCCLLSNAQSITPTWKFWIEFENGDGQKDTITYIWDDNATVGVDTFFNEERVDIDTNRFNVYLLNANSDTTKTSALQFLYPSITDQIYATRVIYPVIIRWDTTLLNSSEGIPAHPITKGFISNDYFFLENNTLADHLYNMMIVDSAYAPEFFWFSQSQFPMAISIERVDIIGLHENVKNPFKIYPNPANDNIRINADKTSLFNIRIFDLIGNEVLFYNNITSNQDIFIGSLTSGVYFMQLNNLNNNKILYEKLIKV